MSDTQRLAKTLMGPRIGTLSPDDEKSFQTFMAFDPNVRQWRNSFINRYGERPNVENDPTFDYRKAWQAGQGPAPYAPDVGFPHWGSAGKLPGHPTGWMQDFVEQFGIDPMTLQSGQVTSDMQEFMRRQGIADLLMGRR